MVNEKAWYILWFCRTSGTVSPSLCEPYQFSLLLFVCIACPWPAYHLRTLADTSLLHGCWLISIRDSVFFSFISPYCRTKHFTLFQSFVFTKVVLLSPPPPLGLVTHFSLSSTLFTFLTSFSQLASLLVCSLCGLCCLCTVPGELD
jgi:hypothetical protein